MFPPVALKLEKRTKWISARLQKRVESRMLNLWKDEELEQVEFEPFFERVNEAKAALGEIRTFFDTGKLGPDGLETICKIAEPPPALL